MSKATKVSGNAANIGFGMNVGAFPVKQGTCKNFPDMPIKKKPKTEVPPATKYEDFVNKNVDFNTGFKKDSPVPVVSSEFISVYNNSGQYSPQGEVLSLKYNAEIQTAKVACKLLTQSKSSVDGVENNKQIMSTYLSEESMLLTQLYKNVSDTNKSITVKFHDDMYKFLLSMGYAETYVKKYTSTKLWQQALIELRKIFMTYPSSMPIGGEYLGRLNEPNDNSAFMLSDVNAPRKSKKHLWLNPYADQLVQQSFFTGYDGKSNIESVASDIMSFHELMFFELWSPDEIDAIEDIFSTPHLNNQHALFLLSNCITKEMLYSRAISSIGVLNVDNFLVNRGYDIAPQAFHMWNYLIGKLEENSHAAHSAPVGNYLSLVSFSKRDVKVDNENYNLLTLEGDYVADTNIVSTLPNPDIPGSVYYLEGVLRVAQQETGPSFNLDRTKQLKKSADDAVKTIDKMFHIFGVTPKEVDGNLVYSASDDPKYRKYDLNYVFDKLKSLSDMYVNEYFILGIDNVTTADLRLAANIMKTAVQPTVTYQKVANNLLAHLFIAYMTAIGGGNVSEIAAKITDIIVGTNSSTDKNVNSKAIFVGSVSKLDSSAKAYWDEYKSNKISFEYFEYQRSINKPPIELTTSIADLLIKSIGKMDSGLWGIVKNLLNEILSDVYLKNGTFTKYSRQPMVAYAYTYFVMILKTIAAITPEELNGSIYKQQYDGDNFTLTTKCHLDVNRVDLFNISNYYEVDSDVTVDFSYLLGLKQEEKSKYKLKISNKNPVILNLNLLQQESTTRIESLKTFRNYASDLSKDVDKFMKFVSSDFQVYLSTVQQAYALDSQLSQQKKNSLLNASLTGEQMKLTNYALSELNERISDEETLKTNLQTLPSFKNFPDKFEKFMSIHGIDLVSYHMLSPYFKGPQFLSSKSVNKRIFGIGLPTGLFKSLKTYYIGNLNDKLQGIVNVKVYKNDLLRPNIVYRPLEYLFEMSRFPTRSLDNWDFDAFSNDTFNLLTIPTKYVNQAGEVIVHKNYSEAFDNDYDSLASNPVVATEIRQRIYSNHATSFLAEEYLRWFTDCRFDETVYYNYVEPKKSSNAKDVQSTQLSNNFAVDGSATVSDVVATYIDPISGQSFTIPIKKNFNSTSKSSTKKFEIPINDTMKSFLKTETFLMDPNVLKRRLVYPKKFDRVFHVIVDPDDFLVDTTYTSQTVLNNAVSSNILTKDGNVYRSRDTTSSDTTFCEYFFSIEPYEYK